MRRSFDGLSLAAQEHLGEDPKSGALFEGAAVRSQRILPAKRLHRARFKIPDTRSIDAKRLAWILRGVET
jgi:transposase